VDALAILEQLAQSGTPSPGVARRIDVGSDLYLRFFEQELLEGLIEKGAATCRIYEGEAGAGKTHLLQLIAEMMQSRGAAVVKVALSDALHLSDWRGLIQHMLQELRVVDSGGEEHRGLPDILMSLTWDASREESLRNLRVPHTGFREAIRIAAIADLAPPAEQALRQFLLGEPITISYLRRHGIQGVKGAVTARNAERVLHTLGACLRALGVPALAILFDETEHTLAHRQQARDALAANLMRRLIDGAANGRLTATFVGFAVLPGTIEQAAMVYPALGQRIRVIGRSEGGYRRPVLDITQINSCRTPLDFLESAVIRISGLATEIGDPPPDLPERLRAEGRTVVEAYASGYRRPLLKQLAMTAVSNV
jgi:hypothetical protein